MSKQQQVMGGGTEHTPHDHGHNHSHGRPAPSNQETQAELGLGGDGAATEGFDVTVESGDTLWDLAGSYLGDPMRWREIYSLNQDVIGADPDRIFPGQVLRIPTNPVPPDQGVPPVAQERSQSTAPPAGGGDPLPEAGDGGNMTVPYVVLARGAGATEAATGTRGAAAQAVVEGWGMPYNASWVRLSTENREPIVALTWQAGWGMMPGNTEMVQHLSPLDARLAMTVISASPGWGAMDEGQRTQLTALIGGETNVLSQTARQQAQSLVMDGGWSSQDADAQAAVLTGLVSDSSARPALVDEPHPDIAPADHALTGPVLEEDHAFRGVTADADVYTVTFADDGHAVTIYAPNAPDPANGHHYTVQQAVHALVRLPHASRSVVTSITLNAVRNPDDAFWAAEYNDPNFESFMTAGAGGDVTIYPAQGAVMTQRYTDDTMVHETGHTWSKQQWGEDTSADAWRPWRDAMASDGISVSNYATASIDEDVAETVQAYITTQGTPAFDEYRSMVPARFAILDNHF
ncbi:MAG: LysM peptidoglycan-binding domain-containing protein [Myxococcota bacterium]